jgi:hypothetical protein
VHGLHQMYHRLKINLDTLDGSPRFEVQLEACFGPFGDSANLDA